MRFSEKSYTKIYSMVLQNYMITQLKLQEEKIWHIAKELIETVRKNFMKLHASALHDRS